MITVKYMELFEDFGEGFEEFPHDSWFTPGAIKCQDVFSISLSGFMAGSFAFKNNFACSYANYYPNVQFHGHTTPKKNTL